MMIAKIFEMIMTIAMIMITKEHGTDYDNGSNYMIMTMTIR